LAVGRPSGDQLRHIVERQSNEIAGGDGHHVDVAAARPRRREGETLAVGGEQRTRFSRRMRDQQAGVAASRRHFPDVAAADECDRRAIG
jgi:hypothetical protein